MLAIDSQTLVDTSTVFPLYPSIDSLPDIPIGVPTGGQFGKVLSQSIESNPALRSPLETGLPGNLPVGNALSASSPFGNPSLASSPFGSTAFESSQPTDSQSTSTPFASSQPTSTPFASSPSPSSPFANSAPVSFQPAIVPSVISDPAGSQTKSPQSTISPSTISEPSNSPFASSRPATTQPTSGSIADSATGGSPTVSSAPASSPSSSSQSQNLQPSSATASLAKPADKDTPAAGDAQKPSPAAGDPAAALSSGYGAASEQQSLLAAAVSGTIQAPILPLTPAKSAGASNSEEDKPAPRPASVAGSDQLHVVATLIETDPLPGVVVNASTAGPPKTDQTQSAGVDGGQAGDVTALRTLIADPPGQPALSPIDPSTVGIPAEHAGTSSTGASSAGAALPAASNPPAAVAALGHQVGAGDLISLIQTATVSSTTVATAPTVDAKPSGAGAAIAGIGTAAPTGQIAQDSATAASSPTLQTSPAAPANSVAGIAGGLQPAVVTVVGSNSANSSLDNSRGNSVLQSGAVQPLSADSASATFQASTSLPASTTVGSTPSAMDTTAQTASPPVSGQGGTGLADAGQSAQQPGAQNASYLPLGSAPPSLQMHPTSFAANQTVAYSSLSSAVVDQTAYAVQYSHVSGQQMQLHLNPPELGALQVDVSMRDGVLSARIEAQTSTAQQILVDNISQLKDSLIQQGVNFDRIEVHLAGSNAGSGGFSSADRSFAQQQQQDGGRPWDQQYSQPQIEKSAAQNPVQVVRDPRMAIKSLDIIV